MSFAVALVIAYLALALVAFFGQRSVMYPVPPGAITPRAPGATLLRLVGPGGEPVHALYLPAPTGGTTLVHFHGNGEQLADVAGLVQAFGHEGLGVMAVEYPGYGLSRDGVTSEANVHAAAERALDHLQGSLGVSRDHTVLLGQSLGTGVAAEMALRGRGARLVLISPYTSMVDMAQRVAWMLPARWLVRDRYDTAAKAPRITLPTLIIHGADDDMVPVGMGQHLGRLFPRVEVEIVARAGHNDLFAVGGARIVARIAEFAKRR
jgi:uncharacterized protein